MSDITSSAPGTLRGTETAPRPVPSSVAPAPPAPRPRLWPAFALIVVLVLARFLPGMIDRENVMLAMLGGFFGPMVVAGLLAIWWLFFSRIPWADRLLGLLLTVVGGVGAWSVANESIGPPVLFFYALPLGLTVWVTWLFVTPFLPWRTRFVGLLVVILLSWGFWDCLRFRGTTGTFVGKFWYRWTLTVEEKRQAENNEAISPPLIAGPGDWTGFRGENRDSVVRGVKIATDWNQNPPRQIWKHEVGPGWSSFAVVGNHLFTQEQLKADERVTCYAADTGEQLWGKADVARFTEGLAGPGPRATPTFAAGKLYTQGATGILNCFDAGTGKKIWSRNIADDSEAKIPTWGFAASPLVMKGVVITYGGAEDKGLLGYDAEKGGKPLWMKGKGGQSYCSPQPARIAGVEQVLIATEKGLSAYDPAAKGAILWEHDWPLSGMPRIAQPAQVGDSDVLLGTFFGYGTRRVHVSVTGTRSSGPTGWSTEEVWTTKAIKPYFNDFVLHKGYLYGFDGDFFTCVDLENGKSKWKVRAGYGSGQVLLLADQDLLLVLTESGEVALVETNPAKHKEIAKFQAINGKTWNHPVIAHGKLFVRNGEEMACYELAPAK